MTNDGTNDMTNTFRVASEMPFTRLEGTRATLKWIEEYEGKK